ncbi:DUF982 domain-containing protein [Rhizobium cremeum]|uniref:DUF982 domain-containing protein n=1 Tax=Rhizobium cremeum TaxID=2813827 RepID=UPI000DDB05A5|nr:DUF982 domain-containing protein [Rhizobium cremeum]MCJ8000947.1 DUF982 domain-containing protein [Rhizobium cremeum]
MQTRNATWSSWVTVRFQQNDVRTLASPQEALELLEKAWPLPGGPQHRSAVNACRGALGKMTPLAIARESFLSACGEAGMACAVRAASPPVYRTHHDLLL